MGAGTALSSRIAVARDWNDVFLLDRAGDAAPVTEPEPEPERRRGMFRRLRENLSKTRQALSAEVQATLFDTLDDETWERLEEALIMADVGVRTTADVVERLEHEATSGAVEGGEALQARLVALLGGTIGNFTPGSRRRLLRDIAGLLGPRDHFLLGTDLVKDPDVIEAAYNDSAGITAEFNRNVLHVMNRELGADFDPEAFEHVAFFDREHEWIEMRLRAREAMRVHVADLQLDIGFEAREEMRTEVSAKFTRQRLERDFAVAGLELRDWHTDPGEAFAVSLAGRRTM